MPAISDLRRSATDSKVAGVCGGVAESWRIDPTLVRVGAVVLALSSGVGLALYGAAWLLVPRSGEQLSILKQKWAWARERTDKTLWVLAVIVGAALVGSFGTAFPLGLWPAAVIGAIWFFGFRDKATTKASAQPTPEVSPTTRAFDAAAAAWLDRVAEHQRTVGDPTETPSTTPGEREHPRAASPVAGPQYGTWGPQHAAAVPPTTAGFVGPVPGGPEPTGPGYTSPVVVTPTTVAVRRRWPGWRIGLTTMLCGFVVLGALSAAGVVVPGAAVTAVALLALAATLIVSAWFGRPRGMIAVAIILAMFTAIGSVIPRDIGQWKFADETLRYSTTSEMPAEISLDGGNLTLDLSDLKVDQARTVNVRQQLGNTTIRLPRAANVNIDWGLSLGDADLPNGKSDGTDISGHYSHRADSNHPAQVLRVEVRMGLGDLVVTAP